MRSLPLLLGCFALTTAREASAQHTSTLATAPDGKLLMLFISDTTPDLEWVAFGANGYDLLPPSGPSPHPSQVYLMETATGSITLISRAANGDWGNAGSTAAYLSDDGGVSSFSSPSDNLVAGDTNGVVDVFVFDAATGVLERPIVDLAGQQPSEACYAAVVSGDGRFVAFSSAAPNLVAGAPAGQLLTYVFDRVSGQLETINLDPNGNIVGTSVGGAMSFDGRFVTFLSDDPSYVAGDTNGFQDVFVRDRVAQTTERVNVGPGGIQANADTYFSGISADGRVVAFWTKASNLVVGDTNGADDVFARDRWTSTTTRVSVSSGGSQTTFGSSYGGRLSANGRFVTFSSEASNLVPGDTNSSTDVFVHDRMTATTKRVSLGQGGTQSSLSSYSPVHTSSDGKRTYFRSHDDALVPATYSTPDVLEFSYLHDEDAAPAGSYCTAKLNSAGCSPFLFGTGTPGYSGSDVWSVHAEHVLNQQIGLLVWSASGNAATPFGGGTLCLAPPILRTAAQFSGGSATGNDCTGSYSFEMGATFLAHEMIPAGSVLFTQYWSRDPFAGPPSAIGLTNALWFYVLP